MSLIPSETADVSALASGGSRYITTGSPHPREGAENRVSGLYTKPKLLKQICKSTQITLLNISTRVDRPMLK